MVPAKILVVEDETIVARDIQQSLTRLGYDVPTTATSGEEAIRKTKEIDPDLILMDIVLKGQMDGVETVRQINRQFDVPVIYLTAYADDATLERAKPRRRQATCSSPSIRTSCGPPSNWRCTGHRSTATLKKACGGWRRPCGV